MLKKLKLSGFFLMIVLALSCGQNPKVKEVKDVKEVKEVKKTSDSLTIAAANSILDDQASFISGMPYNKNECLSRLDSELRR